MSMSITETLRVQTLERKVADLSELKARIDAIEAHLGAPQGAQHVSREIPAPLRRINAFRQTRCNALRTAIANVLAMAPHSESLTAKDVAQALVRAGFEPMPRDRTIRLRLAEARAEMATHGNSGNCQKTA